MDESLEQHPNIVLLAAGTNDMNPNGAISTEGNNPADAADRLGKLIDKINTKCPDATVLVAMIINTCDPAQSPRTQEFQKLIPGVVKGRRDNGKHVFAVDFTSFGTNMLQDCIHPTNDGYKLMGDYWYDFITQIPKKWISNPEGDSPAGDGSSQSNGGIDKDIPDPDWGVSPVQETSKAQIAILAMQALGGGYDTCKANPHWLGTGKLALGNVGHNGDWKYHKDWQEAGKVAAGLGLDSRYVRYVKVCVLVDIFTRADRSMQCHRLHDMNGDGKAGMQMLSHVRDANAIEVINKPRQTTCGFTQRPERLGAG